MATRIVYGLFNEEVRHSLCSDEHQDVRALADDIADKLHELAVLITSKEARPPSAPTMGGRIRQIRKTLGLTQKSFAAELQVKQASVSRWEKEKAVPDEAEIEMIAAMARTTPAAIRYGV
jgi:DNA-binding transcriptional regulator YiaG